MGDDRSAPAEARPPAEGRPVEEFGIRVLDAGKPYGEIRDGSSVWAVRHVTFDVAPGEFFVLLGPSGCGKSTLLRLIAGIMPSTEGRIRTASGPVHGPSRDRGMVFQSIETPLFDWLTA